jgi:succinate dehydrogenase / fumarate reductase, cytochrome b subunit
MLSAAYRSTVGKKVIMAVTGLMLIGFLVGHMAGNLKAFAGIDPTSGLHKLDEYAHFLREIGEKMLGKGGVLWLVRIVLLGAVGLHILSAIQLARINKRARGSSYQTVRYNSSTIASRSMYYGGLVIAFFIVFHILHFTTGNLHFRGFIEGKVYNNVVLAFQSPLIVLIYLAALTAVALHTYHAGWSLFQTLGLDTPQINRPLRIGVKVLAVVLFLGFLAVPFSVLLGGLKPYPEVISLQQESRMQPQSRESARIESPSMPSDQERFQHELPLEPL